MTPLCLRTEHLSRHYGGLRAVEGVDLAVAQGERRAIIGPNGAGKTTLFHLLSGEVEATAGRILLYGRDITRLPSFRRTGLGIGRTYQVTNLFPRLTVLDHALLAVFGLRPAKYDLLRPALHYREACSRAQRLLEELGLWDKREWPIGSLAYGEQRQLEIVLALAGDPKVLLLDEPTAGLAPAETQLVTQIVRSVDPSITVLLIEHDMDVAFEVAQRITVLHFGRVLAEGTVDEIRRNPEVQAIYLGVGEL